MVIVVVVVVVVERRLLQRQSKRSTEEIDNLQRLGLDAIMEPVTSPSTRAVVMDSTVTSCWPGSVRILEPWDWPGLVRERGAQAEVFEYGVVVVGEGVGVGGDACD